MANERTSVSNLKCFESKYLIKVAVTFVGTHWVDACFWFATNVFHIYFKVPLEACVLSQTFWEEKFASYMKCINMAKWKKLSFCSTN